MIYTQQGYVITNSDRTLFLYASGYLDVSVKNVKYAIVYNNFNSAQEAFNKLREDFRLGQGLDSIVPITITYAVGVY